MHSFLSVAPHGDLVRPPRPPDHVSGSARAPDLRARPTTVQCYHSECVSVAMESQSHLKAAVAPLVLFNLGDSANPFEMGGVCCREQLGLPNNMVSSLSIFYREHRPVGITFILHHNWKTMFLYIVLMSR